MQHHSSEQQYPTDKSNNLVKIPILIKIYHRCWRRGDVLGQTKLKLLNLCLYQSRFHTFYPHLLQKRMTFLYIFAFNFETQIWQRDGKNRLTTNYKKKFVYFNLWFRWANIPFYIFIDRTLPTIISLRMKCFLKKIKFSNFEMLICDVSNAFL